MEPTRTCWRRLVALLTEPRHAPYLYCVALLLHSVVCGVSILCLLLAWTNQASQAACTAFVLCVILALSASQHWLQVAAHRYLAPPSLTHTGEEARILLQEE